MENPSLTQFSCQNVQCGCVCSVTSVVSDSVTLWTTAHQTPLPIGFSRQEYWSGLPFPSPGVTQGLNLLVSPALLFPLIGKLMLKLKFQYSGHLIRRTDSVEKTLTLGNIEGRRRRG
ncbi:unnamed protein product [Rangifer tarandus platyrhynchus]|uniref:Uncharacterized protein n=1 Tax=Rangifer tarandus platyrhynchus TaxID=3082113 RepID=A0AC59Z935_RANTA